MVSERLLLLLVLVLYGNMRRSAAAPSLFPSTPVADRRSFLRMSFLLMSCGAASVAPTTMRVFSQAHSRTNSLPESPPPHIAPPPSLSLPSDLQSDASRGRDPAARGRGHHAPHGRGRRRGGRGDRRGGRDVAGEGRYLGHRGGRRRGCRPQALLI